MAHHHHARHGAVHVPRWARRSVVRARRFEQKVERHWPFVAYAALSLGVAAYVIAQLITIT